MGRLRSCGLPLAVAIISFWGISGCGGHRPPGQNPFPARVSLSPSTNTSVQLGGTLNFSATAQNSSNSNVSTSFTFASSDTSILNIAPNGVACAGVWDAAFTSCTPGGIGVVQVTASALGATSSPTFVFVHPPIDNITVTGVLPAEQIVQEPCLSQGQTMTVQAQAFSQGVDVTASVGPFTWSANNSSVVGLTPIVNSAYNFATNQATARAANPGITRIFASASGVSSSTFQQPTLKNTAPVTFDFFETCPIQNIALELGHAGSGQTDFAVAKGTTETIIATVTDVMGTSSLPNTNNGIVLSKIPLTWTASQPAVIPAGTSCTLSCTSSTPSPGAGSITASCSPPSCNIGFPEVPTAFSAANLAACAQYIHSLFPQVTSCQQFIPLPVYASPLPDHTTAAISGFVTGTAGSTSVLATSLGCANEPPAECSVGIYSISTSKAQTNTASPFPVPPNSLLFDPAGAKVFMGSDFGAQVMNPANLGTQNNPFTPLGTVTGKVLAVSPNGNFAIFSDTLHVPNQVYVVNEANATSPTVTPLNISSASVATFSWDGLKAFIFGLDSNNNPTLYVYSTLQALQAIPLSPQTSVNAIAFSTNNAFAYLVEPSLGGAGPAVSVFNTCDNSKISGQADIPLTSAPVAFKALPDGVHFVILEGDGTLQYITASITGIPVATLTQAATSICPMTVSHTVQTINLNQGLIHPVDFFASADGTLLYVLASDRGSILIYNFALGTVTGGIQLVGSGTVTPVTAEMSADATTIMVAGSDGLLHQVSTGLGGSDMFQLEFPNLANFLNPFCTFTPAQGPCTLDSVVVKP
jgi:hypothetical protein